MLKKCVLNRCFALFITIFMLASLFSFQMFSTKSTLHNCSGEDCPFCELSDCNKNISAKICEGTFASVQVLYGFISAISLKNFIYIAADNSLIGLKVKISC